MNQLRFKASAFTVEQLRYILLTLSTIFCPKVIILSRHFWISTTTGVGFALYAVFFTKDVYKFVAV